MGMVASFTDAWIETCRHVRLLSLSRVASFTDAWIETYFDLQERTVYLCRIFYRCVD